jgi:hypothetical protein
MKVYIYIPRTCICIKEREKLKDERSRQPFQKLLIMVVSTSSPLTTGFVSPPPPPPKLGLIYILKEFYKEKVNINWTKISSKKKKT